MYDKIERITNQRTFNKKIFPTMSHYSQLICYKCINHTFNNQPACSPSPKAMDAKNRQVFKT